MIKKLNKTLFMISVVCFSLNGALQLPELSNNKNEKFTFDDIKTLDSQLMEHAYGIAPEELKDIVRMAKTKQNPKKFIRPVLFIGPPGTGKTSTACALVYIMNQSIRKIVEIERRFCSEEDFFDWSAKSSVLESARYKLVSAASLGNKYINSKKEEQKKLFNQIIKEISKKNELCVLIIDEMNALFSDKKNKSNNQAVSAAIGLKHIFEQTKGKRILPIFTTNYPEQIPNEKGLRSFFQHGNYFVFKHANKKSQQRVFNFHLTDPEIGNSLDESDFNAIYPKIKDLSFRAIASLCGIAISKAIEDSYENPVVSKKHINKAVKQLAKNIETLKLNEKEESKEERLDRLRQEESERQHRLQLKLENAKYKDQKNLHDVNMVLGWRTYLNNEGEKATDRHFIDPIMRHERDNMYRHNCANGRIYPNLGHFLPSNVRQVYNNNKLPDNFSEEKQP